MNANLSSDRILTVEAPLQQKAINGISHRIPVKGKVGEKWETPVWNLFLSVFNIYALLKEKYIEMGLSTHFFQLVSFKILNYYIKILSLRVEILKQIKQI